jgi:hypothetical protein
MVELVPARKTNRPSIYTFGATPSKHIIVEVMAGVRMTKYFAPVLSKIYPMNGFNTDGSLERVLIIPAEVRERE